ncbi:hypothetical protein IMZ48_00395 [Candidatus Bathyarchaeota archaeon]|nr:hypothetical protein [Candidatus Bathyarchaeota archaeon]
MMGHRMRHIRTQAAIIRRGLEAGLDPVNMSSAESDFPKDQNKIDPGTRLVPDCLLLSLHSFLGTISTATYECKHR